MRLQDVKEGDQVIADGGFTCLKDGAVLTVKTHPTIGAALGPGHQLYVECDAGGHFLDGQTDDDGEIIGFAKAP